MNTMERTVKTCTKCKEQKPLDAFSRSKQTGDGLAFWCKECRAAAERGRSAEYKCWKNMKARCTNPVHPDYPHYGGRGITIVSEWIGRKGFANFIADAGQKPTPKHQLDRIDNNGNYEPGNVRWVLPVVNMRNRSITRRLTCRGETKTYVEWAEQTGLKDTTITSRLKRGWSVEEAIFGRKTA